MPRLHFRFLYVWLVERLDAQPRTSDGRGHFPGEEHVVTGQRFAIGPLEPGFGHTLGNSLRRTLLSSIPGAAITTVRFDESLHEFDTITGVAEHEVRSGESVWILSLRTYDVPVWLFRQYNPELDLHNVPRGTMLNFPVLAENNPG